MYEATHLLATDLDGTLVGDSTSLKALFDFYQAEPYDMSFVYITGRHYDSALSLITEEKLPLPDVLITDVGTAIYTGNELTQDMDWTQQLEEAWRPQEIDTIARQIPGLISQQLPVTNRCSYYATDSAVVEAFRNELDRANCSYKLIYSGGRDVDILPAGSGKGQALQYILKKYQLDEVTLLVAGDSGNDCDMLTLGFPSVMVGNAQPELLAQPDQPSLYRAHQNYAAGIQEAWRYFHKK